MSESLHAQRFPLAWPPSWPRTEFRVQSRYKVTAERARRDLFRELVLAGAQEIVLSTNVPLRKDGQPFGKYGLLDDPGVAVYWVDLMGESMELACDQYLTVGENIRGVGLAVECLRGLERTGCSEIIRRAAVGFRALPPPPPERHWRDVLGYEPLEGATKPGVERRYRMLASSRHPDVPGGSHLAMSELNRARDEALRDLGG